MAEDNSPVWHPQGPGRSHEILLPQGEKFGPDKSCRPHPTGDTDDDHDVVDARRQEGNHCKDQEETGKTEHDIDQAGDDHIN